MSLDWSIEDCDAELLKEHYPDVETEIGLHWHPITAALPWVLFATGMQRITERNYDEVYRRMGIWYYIVQGMDPRQNDMPTIVDIKRHVGMSTNVSNVSRAQFAAICERQLSLVTKFGPREEL